VEAFFADEAIMLVRRTLDASLTSCHCEEAFFAQAAFFAAF